MKEVALLINERKRRMENIGKAGVWQETIENWKVQLFILLCIVCTVCDYVYTVA